MKTNKLKKYITELDSIITEDFESRTLIYFISTRLEQILAQNSKSRLKHFIETLSIKRSFAKSSEEYKFLEKVIKRLKDIL